MMYKIDESSRLKNVSLLIESQGNSKEMAIAVFGRKP